MHGGSPDRNMAIISCKAPAATIAVLTFSRSASISRALAASDLAALLPSPSTATNNGTAPADTMALRQGFSAAKFASAEDAFCLASWLCTVRSFTSGCAMPTMKSSDLRCSSNAALSITPAAPMASLPPEHSTESNFAAESPALATGFLTITFGGGIGGGICTSTRNCPALKVFPHFSCKSPFQPEGCRISVVTPRRSSSPSSSQSMTVNSIWSPTSTASTSCHMFQIGFKHFCSTSVWNVRSGFPLTWKIKYGSDRPLRSLARKFSARRMWTIALTMVTLGRPVATFRFTSQSSPFRVESFSSAQVHMATMPSVASS
mmetsp:Transcript_3465/g.5740  ORF Transcript_3465/g.5740 Transcript_3465/m.5740 type:complete len:318 (+) Transcript_3465:1308-2261(+)